MLALKRRRRAWFEMLGGLALAFAEPTIARAIEFVVHDLEVSEGGAVDANHVTLPVGGTVTIGARVIDPSEQPVFAVGGSYYGWNPSVLDFSSGVTVGALFHRACFPEVGGVQGLPNQVVSPLVPTRTALGGASPGQPRVRVLQALGLVQRAASVDDPGLDGACGGGDAHFRLTFTAVAEGATTITIGTGDDLGGVIVPERDGATAQATNAVVEVTVPEPGVHLLALAGTLGIAIAAGERGARRRRGTGHRSA